MSCHWAGDRPVIGQQPVSNEVANGFSMVQHSPEPGYCYQQGCVIR